MWMRWKNGREETVIDDWARCIWWSKKTLTQSKQTNSLAIILQANYTDWATAKCRKSLVPTFADRGVSRGQRGGLPTVLNLSFLDRSRYFFFQIAPHLSSQGLSGPLSRPTTTQNIW
jgi:transposase InsO family protein